MIFIEKQIVTAENLETIRETINPGDQSREVEIGQTISSYRSNYKGYNVFTTVWHDALRAGQAQGGDSVWGEWSEANETLTDDQGYEYDLDGDLANSVIDDGV
jgi:hypothetical protein